MSALIISSHDYNGYSAYLSLVSLWVQFEADNEVSPVYSLDAEFSRPFWVFGINSYGFLSGNEGENYILCSYR